MKREHTKPIGFFVRFVSSIEVFAIGRIDGLDLCAGCDGRVYSYDGGGLFLKFVATATPRKPPNFTATPRAWQIWAAKIRESIDWKEKNGIAKNP